MTTRIFLAVMCGATLAASGCGYHLGGKATVIPSSVKTIAVPAFANGTVRYQVANVLGADVARELHARTNYTIVADPAHADAVLNGTVTGFATLGGTTTDPVSGVATSSQVILTVQLRLTDSHTGKVLFSRGGFEFRQAYEISSDLTSYFDESSTAVKRVSQDAARAIVAAILEAF